jgi:hypothetical protein
VERRAKKTALYNPAPLAVVARPGDHVGAPASHIRRRFFRFFPRFENLSVHLSLLSLRRHRGGHAYDIASAVPSAKYLQNKEVTFLPREREFTLFSACAACKLLKAKQLGPE